MLAGSTFCFRAEKSGSCVSNTWDHCDANHFELRVGPNYDRNKQKAPSPESLMELVGVDLIRCDSRLDHIASKVTFPPEWSEGCDDSWRFPHIFVVNVQLPSEFTTSFFTEVTDGPGWSLVLYFKIRQDISAFLASAERNLGDDTPPSNAALLWARYCDGIGSTPPGSTNPWIGRFKVIISCIDIEQYGLPNFIASYNSKPVLIRNTASYYREKGYVEVDVNVHKFGSLPKKALQTQIERLHLMDFNIGFCIESRVDEEMPECIFGCARLNKPNQNTAPNWKDVKDQAPPVAQLNTSLVADHVNTTCLPGENILKRTGNTSEPVQAVSEEVPHPAFNLISFMRHRKALLDIWNMLRGHDQSFGELSSVENIPAVELVSLSDDSLRRNAAYRQRDINGNVIQHMNQLFEVAEIAKPIFDFFLLSVASECSLPTTGRATSASPTSTRSGLVIGDIKSVSRVAEKIREKYLRVNPGPACAWVYDVLRASFVCDTQEQIYHVYNIIRSDPAIKIIRLKNRFQRPTAAGFRDLIINIALPIRKTNGLEVNFICEVQITHVDLRQYEIENNTRAMYSMLWPLLTGSDSRKSHVLAIIQLLVDAIIPIFDSLIPSRERKLLAKKIAEVEDAITKHYDALELQEDIDDLRDWTTVLDALQNFKLAEKNQRKVVKLVSRLHGKDDISVGYESILLGKILEKQQNYTEACACYEEGVKKVAAVLGESCAIVNDTLLRVAAIRISADPRSSEEDIQTLRKQFFGINGTEPVVVKEFTEVRDQIAVPPILWLQPPLSPVERPAIALIVRQHSETHHSAYDVAPLNYNTKPPEMLEPIPDLWDLVSSSGSEFEFDG